MTNSTSWPLTPGPAGPEDQFDSGALGYALLIEHDMGGQGGMSLQGHSTDRQACRRRALTFARQFEPRVLGKINSRRIFMIDPDSHLVELQLTRGVYIFKVTVVAEIQP